MITLLSKLKERYYVRKLNDGDCISIILVTEEKGEILNLSNTIISYDYNSFKYLEREFYSRIHRVNNHWASRIVDIDNMTAGQLGIFYIMIRASKLIKTRYILVTNNNSNKKAQLNGIGYVDMNIETYELKYKEGDS